MSVAVCYLKKFMMRLFVIAAVLLAALFIISCSKDDGVFTASKPGFLSSNDGAMDNGVLVFSRSSLEKNEKIIDADGKKISILQISQEVKISTPVQAIRSELISCTGLVDTKGTDGQGVYLQFNRLGPKLQKAKTFTNLNPEEKLIHLISIAYPADKLGDSAECEYLIRTANPDYNQTYKIKFRQDK